MGQIHQISWASMRPIDFAGRTKPGKPKEGDASGQHSPVDPSILGDTKGLVFPIFGVPKTDTVEAKAKQKSFLAKVAAAAMEVAREMGADKPIDRIRPVNPRDLLEKLPEFADRLAAKLDKRQAPMIHPELNPDVKLENVYKLNYAIDHIPGLRLLLGKEDGPAKRLKRFYSMGAVQLAAGKTSAVEVFLRLFAPKKATSKGAFDGVWQPGDDSITLTSKV